MVLNRLYFPWEFHLNGSLFLSKQYPYTWAENYISYLGINLTKQVSSLFRANYVSFLNNLPKDLGNLSKYNFIWSGRLAAFKMVKLPQILYIFRSLSIPVPASFFASLQSILGKFTWEMFKASISRSNLIKHRLVGVQDT